MVKTLTRGSRGHILKHLEMLGISNNCHVSFRGLCVYASRQFFRNKDHFFNLKFYWHLEGLSPFFVPKKKGFPKFEPPQHLHPPNKTLHKNGKQLGLSVICLFDVWKKSDIFSQIVVWWWCTMVQSAKIHLEINPSKEKIFKIVHCSKWLGKPPTSLFITWNKSGKSFKFTIHLHCLIPPNDACSMPCLERDWTKNFWKFVISQQIQTLYETHTFRANPKRKFAHGYFCYPMSHHNLTRFIKKKQYILVH